MMGRAMAPRNLIFRKFLSMAIALSFLSIKASTMPWDVESLFSPPCSRRPGPGPLGKVPWYAKILHSLKFIHL